MAVSPDLLALLDRDLAGLQRARRLLMDLPGDPPAEILDHSRAAHDAVRALEGAVARLVAFAPLEIPAA